jgi:alkaline phosphatase D
VCSVNETATNSQKATAGCDRDEGPVDIRYTAAAQAYMEWMPVRRGPGKMGVVNITSITQVIEWGKLASIVMFDTRISQRSKEPTLDSCKYFDARNCHLIERKFD